MRYLKKIDEVLRTKDMSGEEEAELEFNEAYKTGRSSPNIIYLGDSWKKVSSKYSLYDNYYLYEENIFILQSSGDYSWNLTRLKDEPHVFKTKIYDRIQQLENAFNKI